MSLFSYNTSSFTFCFFTVCLHFQTFCPMYAVNVLLSGFLFGNLSMILYSMAGGIFSLAIMVLLRKTGGFSIQGVSIAGGVFHNIGQLLLAMMIVETYQVGYYFPVLLISGLVTGLLIGIVSSEVLKRTAFLKKAE